MHSRQEDGAGTDPDILADDDGRDIVDVALVRRQAVIDGGQGHPMADERPVADADPALILKTATGIDEDTAPDTDIFAEVGIEWREQTERLIYRTSRDPLHDLPDLFRRMEGIVQFRGQAHGFVRIGVHAVKSIRTCDQRLSRIQVFQQRIQRHHGSFSPHDENQAGRRKAAGDLLSFQKG